MIDVIVLTVDFDGGNIDALMKNLSDVPHRLIVVDNGPEPFLRSVGVTGSGDYYLIGGRHLNYSQSLNLAMRHRDPSRRVLFISDDARPREGAINAMLAHDEDFVSTINVSSDGLVNHAGMIFAGAGPVHVGRGARLQDLPQDCRHYPLATFACTLVKPDVLDAVGDFDETYQWSHEEVDYMLRAQELGFSKPLVCADAIIDHDEHGVSDTPRQFAQNVAHYNEKWVTSGRLERLWQPQMS